MTKTVLIIDDDVELSEILSDILEEKQYHVLVANDGLQAIKKTKGEKIDLILLDIQMPYMSGFWFCDLFKKKMDTKKIPIVMISGLSKEENAKKAYQLGACAFLKKPFEFEELFEVLEKHIS